MYWIYALFEMKNAYIKWIKILTIEKRLLFDKKILYELDVYALLRWIPHYFDLRSYKPYGWGKKEEVKIEEEESEPWIEF